MPARIPNVAMRTTSIRVALFFMTLFLILKRDYGTAPNFLQTAANISSLIMFIILSQYQENCLII
jgi:hypothetical protein